MVRQVYGTKRRVRQRRDFDARSPSCLPRNRTRGGYVGLRTDVHCVGPVAVDRRALPTSAPERLGARHIAEARD